MAKILINRTVEVDGEVVVSNRIENDTNGNRYVVTEGFLKMKTYIEEIDTIDTKLFSIDEVFVIEETFSSEENVIVYRFIAQDLKIDEEEYNE